MMDINPIYMLSTMFIKHVPVFITLNVMAIIAAFCGMIYLIEAIRDIFILYT